MADEQKKKQWGGRREGAGRPSTDSKLYSIRMPRYISEVIDRQKSKTEFIRNCITRVLNNDAEMLKSIGTVYKASEIKDIKLPYFDIGLAAGFPVPLDNDERSQDIELLRMLCPNPDSSYLIRVEGSSMIDAGIFSGDVVIVDKSNRMPDENEVAVCEFNGEYTLKRFVKREGQGWLIPANPEFPRIKITEEDDFSVWGTVTYVIHRPRN